jgi:septum formation protein
MLEQLAGYRLVLASNSPRRKELLDGLGLPYSVRTVPSTDESYPPHLTGAAVAEHIAAAKAAAFAAKQAPDELILTADTIVCRGASVFGKPTDRADALRMLQALSGNSHTVYTGVCLSSLQHRVVFSASTDVFFSTLSPAECAYYVDTYRPYDKAGAYGIQEWLGFAAVERIEGSYYNVMGLPVHQLYLELKRFPPLNTV